MTASLDKIPENFSVSYFPVDVKVSGRNLERGLNYYTQGYVHDVRISEGTDDEILVSAKCWRSMRKNETPHKLQFGVKDGAIKDAYCSCKAGLSGRCSHIVGLVKTVQGFKLHNFVEIPDQLSCTSIPQQWHIPRGNRIQPVSLNNIIVARPIEERKRKPVLCQPSPNFKIAKITSTDIATLSALVGTPFASRKQRDSVPMTQTAIGSFYTGSFLSYQNDEVDNITVPVSHRCGIVSVCNKSPISLPEEFHFLRTDSYCNNSKDLEKNTRNQAESQLWYKERKKRLTASNFGKILSRKKLPNNPFLASIFKDRSISTAATDYGKRHERDAKAKYMKIFPSRHLHECGFVVNNEFPFLGATPDGILCENGQSGIIEIKCPYTARNSTIEQAVDDKEIIFLRKNSQNIIAVNNAHHYYAQIQGQLMITGCDFCEFIVFTQKDIFTQRVLPDIAYMKSMLHKLATFYKDFASPYLRSVLAQTNLHQTNCETS